MSCSSTNRLIKKVLKIARKDAQKIIEKDESPEQQKDLKDESKEIAESRQSEIPVTETDVTSELKIELRDKLIQLADEIENDVGDVGDIGDVDMS